MSKKYSETEKLELVEKLKESKQSMTAFARAHGIPPSTISQWVRKEKREEFGELKIRPYVEEEINTTKAIVFSSEDIKIELKANYDKVFLKKIMEVLV